MNELEQGLARAMTRAGFLAAEDRPANIQRLTGGATMESWRFSCGGDDFVLRRAPSLAFMEGRPFGHATEAAVIRAARAAWVTAPEVVTVLEEGDGIGSGFVMRALRGTPDPKAILAMDGADTILREAARDLARIHSLRRDDLPTDVPVMDYRAAIADLRAQYLEAGGDRPIIALGLRWMEDNCPDPVEPVLNHGDYRMGNILCEAGHLSGVLDWELAHFGDRHEDLAFGCMAVWRFARYDRPALGLGSLEQYFAAYEAESGHRVDRARFRYWLVHRTVWWALGCLKCAKVWRDGSDRMLERVVISRRTSEQELDLLLLLEEDTAHGASVLPLRKIPRLTFAHGAAQIDELALAVSEWLGTIKDSLSGHDRFQLAVARNALGILAREHGNFAYADGIGDSELVLRGEVSLDDPAWLAKMRAEALAQIAVDSPKYPARAHARKKWTGED